VGLLALAALELRVLRLLLLVLGLLLAGALDLNSGSDLRLVSCVALVRAAPLLRLL